VAVTVYVVCVACSSHAGMDGLIVSGLPTRALAHCIYTEQLITVVANCVETQKQIFLF
jgi:hypothetical protein